MPTRAPRHTLSRPRVLTAALDLVDEQGLAALTMRSLAQRLEVKPMALYHHVADKAEILDHLLDAVYAQIQTPDPTAPWREQLRARSLSTRSVLRRHPWVVGLLETRTVATRPATLAHHEAVLGLLAAEGAAPDTALRAALLIDGFVWGFVLEELSLPGSTDEAAALVADADVPHVRRALAALFETPGRLDQEFAAGLDLVLDSVAGLLEPERD